MENERRPVPQESIRGTVVGLVREGYATGVKLERNEDVVAAIMPTRPDNSGIQKYLAIFGTAEPSSRYYTITILGDSAEDTADDKMARGQYIQKFSRGGTTLSVDTHPHDSPEEVLQKLHEEGDSTAMYGFKRIASDTEEGQQELFALFEDTTQAIEQRTQRAHQTDKTFVETFGQHTGIVYTHDNK